MRSVKSACKAAVSTALFGTGILLMTSLASANDFDVYTNAYRSVTANGGFDADLVADFTLDGVEKEATGNFKVDNSGEKTLLYLEVDLDGETVTQFSDGEFLYVDARGEKSKYPLGEKQGQEDSRKEPEKEGEEEKSAPTFDTDQFLQEFASCLEAYSRCPKAVSRCDMDSVFLCDACCFITSSKHLRPVFNVLLCIWNDNGLSCCT